MWGIGSWERGVYGVWGLVSGLVLILFWVDWFWLGLGLGLAGSDARGPPILEMQSDARSDGSLTPPQSRVLCVFPFFFFCLFSPPFYRSIDVARHYWASWDGVLLFLPLFYFVSSLRSMISV